MGVWQRSADVDLVARIDRKVVASNTLHAVGLESGFAVCSGSLLQELSAQGMVLKESSIPGSCGKIARLGDSYVIAGLYSWAMDWGPGLQFPAPEAGETGVFVARVDADFNPVWVKVGNGSDRHPSLGLAIAGLAVDGDSIVVAGSTDGNIGFEPLPAAFSGSGTTDIWTASFSGSGEMRWARRFGSTGHNSVTSLLLKGNKLLLDIYTSTSIVFDEGIVVGEMSTLEFLQ